MRLPSLTGLGFVFTSVPSAEALGYYRGETILFALAAPVPSLAGASAK